MAVEDVFTPTFLPTNTATYQPRPEGTVIEYSSWRQAVGTNTAVVLRSAAPSRLALHPRWLAVTAALSAGLTGGAWLALA